MHCGKTWIPSLPRCTCNTNIITIRLLHIWDDCECQINSWFGKRLYQESITILFLIKEWQCVWGAECRQELPHNITLGKINTQNKERNMLQPFNLLYTDFEIWQQVNVFQIKKKKERKRKKKRKKMKWNSNFYCYIWIWHQKCIPMSTSKPSIGSVICKIPPQIFAKIAEMLNFCSLCYYTQHVKL